MFSESKQGPFGLTLSAPGGGRGSGPWPAGRSPGALPLLPLLPLRRSGGSREGRCEGRVGSRSSEGGCCWPRRGRERGSLQHAWGPWARATCASPVLHARLPRGRMRSSSSGSKREWRWRLGASQPRRRAPRWALQEAGGVLLPPRMLSPDQHSCAPRGFITETAPSQDLGYLGIPPPFQGLRCRISCPALKARGLRCPGQR